jgi:hypothetical protein
MKYVNVILMGVMLFCIATFTMAGDLDSPAAPSSGSSAMYTLDDVYNRLNDNTQATKRSGAFDEPDAAPGSTGHTLDQVYEKAIPTQVPKTGQTISYDTGDDGDLQKGVSWPSTRFTDNSDGTVTDNLTGLTWLKNANAFGSRNWATALTDCNTLNSGEHGLTDGSVEGDWRLPNIYELESLRDMSQYNPALPSGHPFTSVMSDYYWSSTTRAAATSVAWDVGFYDGYVLVGNKTSTCYVWPVRGGQ